MQTWFECTLKYTKVDQDGRERKVSEPYLIDAVSFTDAEARITEKANDLIRNGLFAVKNIKQSNVIEVFPNLDGGFWYKAKINIVTIDERAGKEKKVNEYFLIEAEDISDALSKLHDGLSDILVPYEVTAIAQTTVCDVFPYFADDETGATDETEN